MKVNMSWWVHVIHFCNKLSLARIAWDQKLEGFFWSALLFWASSCNCKASEYCQKVGKKSISLWAAFIFNGTTAAPRNQSWDCYLVLCLYGLLSTGCLKGLFCTQQRERGVWSQKCSEVKWLAKAMQQGRAETLSDQVLYSLGKASFK